MFEEISRVNAVGVWPVGYSGARRAETPIVENGVVTSFKSWVTAARKEFPVDMAAFAVSVKYFLKPQPVLFEPLCPTSQGEVRFLKATGITRQQLEPMASQCTEVLVWHVKTNARVEAKWDQDSSAIQDV